jgi:hypothetical protein
MLWPTLDIEDSSPEHPETVITGTIPNLDYIKEDTKGPRVGAPPPEDTPALP